MKLTNGLFLFSFVILSTQVRAQAPAAPATAVAPVELDAVAQKIADLEAAANETLAAQTKENGEIPDQNKARDEARLKTIADSLLIMTKKDFKNAVLKKNSQAQAAAELSKVSYRKLKDIKAQLVIMQGSVYPQVKDQATTLLLSISNFESGLIKDNDPDKELHDLKAQEEKIKSIVKLASERKACYPISTVTKWKEDLLLVQAEFVQKREALKGTPNVSFYGFSAMKATLSAGYTKSIDDIKKVVEEKLNPCLDAQLLAEENTKKLTNDSSNADIDANAKAHHDVSVQQKELEVRIQPGVVQQAVGPAVSKK